MRIYAGIAASILLASCATAPQTSVAPVSAPAAASTSSQNETTRFKAMLVDEWEWQLREFPTFATSLGDLRYNDKLTDISAAALDRRDAHDRELLTRVRSIDRTKLSAEDQLNYDLFLRDAEDSVESLAFSSKYLRMNQGGGIASQSAGLAQSMPKSTVKHYDDFITRLQQLPQQVDWTIELLREGVRKGVTPPSITLRNVAETIGNQIHEDPTRSPIYTSALEGMGSSISATEAAAIRTKLASAIAGSATPAFRKLRTYFVDEYYPATRKSIGMSELPNGKAWYDSRVRQMTTTDLTAEQVHTLGLSEVARIRALMEEVKTSTGYRGELQSFFEFLRTDPQFFHNSREELLVAYRDISKRIDPELPKLFGKLPRLPYGVIAIPSYQEKNTTTAYYTDGSEAAGRAGYFWANTYDLKARPKWEMEALTLHEAVPGHHLQISLAQELPDAPNFRKFGGYTAFIEGWGLYAESLGGDLGMYKDPYSRFGQLTYEMWRAVRLVVDTGMHSKGWTRQQAIDFFKSNSSKPEHDITVEIDRYINNPGQALAYKLGELKMKELRALATSELGATFDIRAFHDELLSNGAVPLSVLDARMREWIQKTAQSKQ